MSEEKKKKICELVIFQCFLNVINESKSSLEPEEMATVVNALVKGNKFCFRRKIPKDVIDSCRCIEKLLIESEQNSVEFLCILIDNPYSYNFGTEAIMDMLQQFAVKHDVPFNDTLIDALEQGLLDAIDPTFVDYIKNTKDNALMTTILSTLDNFDIIGKFLRNFILDEMVVSKIIIWKKH